MSNIIFTETPAKQLKATLSNYPSDKVFILCDENTLKHCVPHIQSALPEASHTILIKSGEEEKNLITIQLIWDFLIAHKADRSSVLINLGGGVITDMGGFAASTFKRGIDFINIPTTLLSQTDASAGGKTGINFRGFKNEIGLFSQAEIVIISTIFLRTLCKEEFLSGFAEMIKHSLIYSSAHFTELIKFHTKYKDSLQDNNEIATLVETSVKIKEEFVKNDITEKGKRKALNFGHTFGHAFESMCMEKGEPLKHGFAVAYGMICELFLSTKLCNFPYSDFDQISTEIFKIYTHFIFTEKEFDKLHELMQHDKKNSANQINTSLLQEIGVPIINIKLNKDNVKQALINFLEISSLSNSEHES